MTDSKRKKPKPISKRRLKYLKGRVNGLTKMDAALQAGYSKHTAAAAGSHIETPEVRAAFARMVRDQTPAKKIAQRIKEGLDAMETKFFQFEGKVTSKRIVIAWSERRQYAALAAEMGGYHAPPKQEGDKGAKVLIQFIRDAPTPAIQVATKPAI